ncbi:MAG: DNA internalization-related competence protein ComEC/Rec2 [Burkholderiaceae bacterium]|nr:DNA internalization-related competence protein ComEC/Rec2 [Burkholderiaceae bacterium]
MIALALAAFVAGAWLLQQQAALPPLGELAAVVLGVLAAAVLAVLFMRQTSAWVRWAARGLVVAAGVAAGFGYAAGRAELRLADELAAADEGRDVIVVGVIESLPAQLERGERFEFAVERVGTPGVHVPARIALSWFGASSGVVPAERWRFTVRLRRPHGSFNPGGFDLEAWMLERNLRAGGYVREGRAAETSPAPQRLARQVLDPGANIDRARYRLRDLLQQRLVDQRYAGVLVALVLGDQRAIGEADWHLFNATGISHLVSISGLHITMIAGLVAGLVAALWRRSARLLRWGPVQTAAAVAGMLAALLYCLLAGWGVPAQRTFFMLSVVALALLARTSMAPAVTLALAAAVVTLIDPWASAAHGFWLSFGAVAAILLALRGRRAQPSGWRARLLMAGQVQAAVTIALVPLTIALFQQVSLVSPLANAVAIPIVSLVVTPLALLGGLFVLLPAPLDSFAVPSLAIGHALFEALAQALGWAAGLGWASLALPAPPPWALGFALAGVLWLLMPRGWPLRWLGLVWLLPLFVWPPQRPAPDELWVTALDVGQGAAVLIETRTRTILYDTGPRYTAQADAGGRVILPYLRWRGIDRLDLLVVSHLDSDHSGGAASVLRGLPGTPVFTSIDPAHPMFADAGGVQRCTDQDPVVSASGQLEARFLHPTAADYDERRSTNAMSCVLLLAFGAHRLLLTGDAPARQEAELLARDPLGPVTLLAAPHHGSRNSSSAALVAATQPRWVLFQAGYRNRFGHPDPSVVAAYRAAGAQIGRSDHHGALQWRLRASGNPVPAVAAARQQLRRYWHNQPAERLRAPPDAEVDRLPDDAEPALGLPPTTWPGEVPFALEP